jgi:DNA (cytosine-5)-methyltransferase 1
MRKLRVLDLFSGIGGFSLGLERTGGFETVAFCEIEEFPRKVLAKHWPDVPCFHDVRKLTRADIDGAVDVICGGYPCQPFSTAGRRLGQKDDRHLWPEFARLVEEFRPTWVVGENVAGHISMGLDDVLSDLERLGYAARSFNIPACAVDAQHKRARIWTVAHSARERRGEAGQHRSEQSAEWITCGGALMAYTGPEGFRLGNLHPGIPGQEEREEGRETAVMGGEARRREILADTERGGRPGPGQPVIAGNHAPGREGQAIEPFDGRFFAKWSAEPAVGRVANGVPGRVDRLKALGNAVVPQIPELIGHAILEAERAA